MKVCTNCHLNNLFNLVYLWWQPFISGQNKLVLWWNKIEVIVLCQWLAINNQALNHQRSRKKYCQKRERIQNQDQVSYLTQEMMANVSWNFTQLTKKDVITHWEIKFLFQVHKETFKTSSKDAFRRCNIYGCLQILILWISKLIFS